jgi:hypothetical protein
MSNLSHNQSSPFDSIRRTDEHGNEFWYGRELMPLIEYVKWQRFEDVIDRAKISCEVAGFKAEDHFSHLPGSVTAKGRFGNDYKLSRYACHLVAMNGDVRKSAIAHAQAYFSSKASQSEPITSALPQASQADLTRQVIEEAEVSIDWLVSKLGIDETLGKQMMIDVVLSQRPHLKPVFEQAKKLIGASDPLDTVGMNVTQVGEHLSPALKAAEVNTLLEKMGLQYKVGRASTKTGKLKYFWQLTKEGERHSVVHKVTSSNTEWNGNQIKWQKSVVELIQEQLDSK